MSKPDETILSPDARAIVDAARIEEDPSGADVDRLRGRVFAHLGLGIGTAAAASLVAGTTAEAAVATTASASAAKAVVSSSAALAAGSGATSVAGSGATASVATTATVGLFAKLGLVGSAATAAKLALAVAVASAGTAGVVALAGPGDPIAPAGSSAVSVGSQANEAREAAVRSSAARRAPAEAHDSGPGEIPTLPERAADAVPSPGAAAAVPRPLASPASQGPAADPLTDPLADPLAEETALVARAQSALAAGRHEDALAALDEHQRRFPRGALAQERNGARLLALCGSGRAAQARDAVNAFLAAQPSSPLAARLRSACSL